MTRKEIKIYYCKEIDCNNIIHPYTALYGQGRCNSCSAKIREKNKPKKKHYCKELGCNNEVCRKNRRCLKCNRKYLSGKNSPSYIDNRSNKTYYCKDCGKEISVNSGFYGLGRCGSCANKLKWKNKKYRENIMRKFKPNKPEKLLNRLLNKRFNKEYKYVGSGEVVLGGLNPDFINCNGQKKIVELYGCYWHNCKKCGFGNGRKIDKRRIKTYIQYGYKTLIIWEHELKELNKLELKIKKFNKSKVNIRR